jgi:hypothetical protein
LHSGPESQAFCVARSGCAVSIVFCDYIGSWDLSIIAAFCPALMQRFVVGSPDREEKNKIRTDRDLSATHDGQRK